MTKNQRVNELIRLWLSFNDKQQEIESIYGRSYSSTARAIETKGEMTKCTRPGYDGYTIRLYETRGIYISNKERYASALFELLPHTERLILASYTYYKDKINKVTQQYYRKRDLAYELGMEEKAYKDERKRLSDKLIELDNLAKHGITLTT